MSNLSQDLLTDAAFSGAFGEAGIEKLRKKGRYVSRQDFDEILESIKDSDRVWREAQQHPSTPPPTGEQITSWKTVEDWLRRWGFADGVLRCHYRHRGDEVPWGHIVEESATKQDGEALREMFVVKFKDRQPVMEPEAGESIIRKDVVEIVVNKEMTLKELKRKLADEAGLSLKWRHSYSARHPVSNDA